MTFRLRLFLTSLATLAIGLGALVVAGNVLLNVRVQSERSSLLQARADTQVAALTVTTAGIRERRIANDITIDRRAWVFAGDRLIERPANVLPAVDRAAIALGGTAGSAERDGPDDERFLVRPIKAPGSGRRIGSVVVALSAAPLETLQKEVLLGSLVIAGLILLAGAVAIRSAVEGALRPVAQMTTRAEDWSEHDLERRFDLGPPSDELSGLAATLDHLLGRIAASRRHEQRFASEVAHELRTPIAGLRGRAELALQATGAEAGREREDALEAVITHTDRVTAAVDALLAAARGELASEGASDLLALANELEDVAVSGDAVPMVEGEPALLRRALAPLIDNARRHARTRVEVRLSAVGERVRLEVLDDGPGLDPALGDRAFDPGVRAATETGDGAGLGLALARRLARSCGGDVVAGAGPGGHVVLELPAAGPD